MSHEFISFIGLNKEMFVTNQLSIFRVVNIIQLMSEMEHKVFLNLAY